jgi:hypothetical protein
MHRRPSKIGPSTAICFATTPLRRWARQTLYTYLGWLCTLGAQYQQPLATTLEVIKRSGTAMIDLDSMKCLGH